MKATRSNRTRIYSNVSRKAWKNSSSDRWQEYLRTQARFRNYSAGNVMLILGQRPNASQVAGFHAWRQMGRWVKKGEKGIAIFAPMTRKISTIDDSGDESSIYKLVGFKVVYVFDVAQTDGKPLPEPAQLLDVEGTESTMQMMLGVAQKMGVTVRFEAVDGANGYFKRSASASLVVVDHNIPAAQQLKTLVHELAHATLHAQWDPDIGTEQREVEAESTAYIVCQHLGLDSSDFSFGYVAEWANSDPELVTRYGERIRKAAKRIIDLI